MTNPDYERGQVNEKLRKLEQEVAEMREDVREIRDVVVSVKGGWKTLAIIAAASSAIGAMFTKIIPWLMSLPR